MSVTIVAQTHREQHVRLLVHEKLRQRNEETMGAILKKYFDLVKEKGGLGARMRLVMRINITSDSAEQHPDSHEDIERLRTAAKEILGEELPVL